MPLQVGEFVHNRYQIRQRVGSSERHVFYIGFDHAYQVEVALRETLITSPEERQIWLQKVILQSNLRHPNLMQITDHFEHGEETLISVSNHAGSRSILDPASNPKGLPIHTAAAAVLAICDAVESLHKGQPAMIHGSINPETVRITAHGQFLLVFPDWVVRKEVDESLSQEPEDQSIQRDIDSLSLLLLSLITAQPAEKFLVEVTENTLRDFLSSAVEPVPPSILKVLEKGLIGNPDHRYKNVGDLKNALLAGLVSASQPQPDNTQVPFRSQSIKIDLQGPPTSPSVESPEVRTSQEIAQPSTPPIRRRVPWGLL